MPYLENEYPITDPRTTPQDPAVDPETPAAPLKVDQVKNYDSTIVNPKKTSGGASGESPQEERLQHYAGDAAHKAVKSEQEYDRAHTIFNE